jgi:hypothetical protein
MLGKFRIIFYSDKGTTVNTIFRTVAMYNDTVEQPARKRYKNAFKQSAADRRLYDRRNLTALDRKVCILAT